MEERHLRMNKAVMIPIQPKFSKMIKDGLKDLEIRPYEIPEGTKGYIYESLGKIIGKQYDDYGNFEYNVHEGQSKVVAEFVVGKIHKLSFNNVLEMVFSDKLSYKDIKERACVDYTYFTPEKEYYAMEITKLIVYEPFENYEGFGKVAWNTLCQRNVNGYDMCVGCYYYSDNSKSDCLTLSANCSKPTEPLDISEFVGWNRFVEEHGFEPSSYRDWIDNNHEDVCEHCAYTDFGSAKVNTGPHNLCYGENCLEAEEAHLDNLMDQCKLTHAPQGKVYVVERDD